MKIHAAGDWSEAQVCASWTPSTRRIDPQVEADIARAWDEASARLGTKLFDGPMCRLERWHATPQRLDLVLSRTSYRPFLGTNLTNPNLPPDVSANPLGLSSPLESADGYLLLGQRNDQVAYYPNRVHPFAGALEPHEPLDVFAEIRRELREELSFGDADISSIRCIGLAEDERLRQPELLFHVHAIQTRAQIEAQLDHGEHRAIYAIRTDPADVQRAIDDPLLTPIAAASLMLWMKHRGIT
jgi:hypothetical protein